MSPNEPNHALCTCGHWRDEHTADTDHDFEFSTVLNTPQAIADRGGDHSEIEACDCALCTALATQWRCPVCKLPAYRIENDAKTCYTCSYKKFDDTSGFYFDLGQDIVMPCDVQGGKESDQYVAQRTYLSAAQYALAAANSREALNEEAAAEVARSLAALFRDLAAVGQRTGQVPQAEQLELPFPEPKGTPSNE